MVKPDDTAELRPVKLGQRQGENVVVTQGVAANERVVLAGQMLVRPGGKVRVDPGSPAGQPRMRTARPTRAPGGQS